MMEKQPKKPREGKVREPDLAFSAGLGDLLKISFPFFFLFRDDLVCYFSIAKYVLIIRYSEDMENQKDEDKIVILALPQRKVFWYISL